MHHPAARGFRINLGLVSATPASTTATAAASTTATASATATTAGTAATAAANLEIGVADDEAASHEAVHVVNLRTFHEGRAFRVNEDLHTGGVDNEVVHLRFTFHAEHVLETAVWSGNYHHSQQSAGFALLVQYLFELLRSQVGNLDKRSCCHRYTSGR